jgi:hypothetical protein
LIGVSGPCTYPWLEPAAEEQKLPPAGGGQLGQALLLLLYWQVKKVENNLLSQKLSVAGPSPKKEVWAPAGFFGANKTNAR